MPGSGQCLTPASNLRVYKSTTQEFSYFDLFKENVTYTLIMTTFNHCYMHKAESKLITIFYNSSFSYDLPLPLTALLFWKLIPII